MHLPFYWQLLGEQPIQMTRPDQASIDSALVTHAQLTRDICAAMSSAMMSPRQIWLAQTPLPESIRKKLTNMPIVPAQVFRPDSQGVLDKSRHTSLFSVHSAGLQLPGLSQGLPACASVLLGSSRAMVVWQATTCRVLHL